MNDGAILYTTGPSADTSWPARGDIIAQGSRARAPYIERIMMLDDSHGEPGMIAVLAALALALAQAQPQPQADAPADLEELRNIYQTSCGNRAYGSYDDVCNQLQDQVRQAEAAADRAEREAKRKAEKEAREAKAHPRDPSKAAAQVAPPPAPEPRLGEPPPPKG